MPPSHPVCADVLNQKGVGSRWQRYTVRKSGLSETLSLMSGPYVRHEIARDKLFESSTLLCCSPDLLITGD